MTGVQTCALPISYLKTIGKSKVLAATLSDTEPEDDSDNKDDGILNAFTATVSPTERIVEDMDEEEGLVECSSRSSSTLLNFLVASL